MMTKLEIKPNSQTFIVTESHEIEKKSIEILFLLPRQNDKKKLYYFSKANTIFFQNTMITSETSTYSQLNLTHRYVI